MIFNIKIEILKILSYLNLKSNFFKISHESKDILIFSIIGSILLIIISIFLKFKIKKFNKKIDNKEKYIFYYIGKNIFEFFEDTIGFLNKNIFNFGVSIFLIILFYNLLVLFPHLEEPTKDINVCIGLSIYSAYMMNYISFKIDKKKYISHWISMPINLKTFIFSNKILNFIEITIKIILNLSICILMMPFHLLDKFSLILSTSFRLFGNIYGGSMVTSLAKKFMYKSFFNHLISSFLGLNILLMGFFGLFEGFIQAFVFTLIGLNNIGMMLEGISKEKLEDNYNEHI